MVTTSPETTKLKEWTFRYYPTASSEIPPVLYILRKLKVKDLGVLYLDDEFGRSVFEFLERKLTKIGGTVKSKDFKPGELDFREQISKLKDMEAIFCVGFPEHFRKIFKQLREANYKGHILGSSDAAIPFVFNRSEANEVYLVAPVIYNPNFLFAKKVKDKYETLYKKSFNHMAANGYDVVEILSGLLVDKEISRQNLKRILDMGFAYDGIFGSVDVKAGDHDIAFPLHPAQIVEGEVEYLR